MMAKGPNETVLIEVKSRSELREDKQLAKLAAAIKKHPGWRLELIAINPKPDHRRPSHMQKERLCARLSESAKLRRTGHLEAAFLLDWSALEAAVGAIAEKYDIDVRNKSTWYSTKKLYSLGILSKAECDQIQRELRKRNSIAHGRDLSLTKRDADRLAILVRKILALLDSKTDQSEGSSRYTA
jgi:hypothetical protein